MGKKFLTLILINITLGISSVFATDQLTISSVFDFAEGDQKALNKWVAETGADIYRHLNNHPNFGYPEETHNPDYFTRSEYWFATQPFGSNQVDFIKKKDVLASVATKSILNSKGRFDCRIAQRIVFLECMRRLMGDIVFDECCKQFETELSQDIFAKKGETRMLYLCGGETLNPYFRYTTKEKQTLYLSPFIGYFGYIPNIPEYAALHPYGLLRGDHALSCSDPQVKNNTLYAGYGSFYKEGGLCWKAIIERFKNETLVISLPEKAIIDEKKRNNLPLVKALERLHESKLNEQKCIIESLQNTYEEKIQELQINFREPSTSYFINLNEIRNVLNM